MQRYKSGAFVSQWRDLKRHCPKCQKYIQKYRRKCPHCGQLIRNEYGKVYAR